jgi:uncharacterized protein YggE
MSKHVFTAVLLVCAAGASAQTLQPPHISVYGTADINVTPNEMNWTLLVLNEGKELAPTASEHARTVARVLEFLKSLNIDQQKLQTSNMQFGERHEYQERRNVKVGYYASTNIGFTIKDLDLYQKLWFGLSEISQVSIQNVSYSHSDRIRLQNEARQKALLAAREKADALARTLGSKIGAPLQIEEQPSQAPPVPFARMASNVAFDGAEGAQPQTLQPGRITITAQVRVTFKLKN